MSNEELITVRERLENLKKKPDPYQNILDEIPDIGGKPLGDGMYTFERVFQQKVDKAIKRIDVLKERMKSSEMFINFFHDLKRAEKEFLDLLAEAEKRKIIFPDNFNDRIEEVKSQIRHKIR